LVVGDETPTGERLLDPRAAPRRRRRFVLLVGPSTDPFVTFVTALFCLWFWPRATLIALHEYKRGA